MSRTQLRGESRDIRSPTKHDLGERGSPLVVDLEVPIEGVDESVTLDWGEVLGEAIEQQQQDERDRLAKKALKKCPEAQIVVLNMNSEEVIATAESSHELATVIEDIEYDPNEALIVRRDEWES